MSELNQAIKEAMTAMLIKFNSRLNKSQRESEATLADWATYLAFERKFKVAQVAVALESLMSKNTRFMPSAYEIADELKPKDVTSEDIGNFIANEVIQKASSKWGIHRLDKAFEDLSDPAKAVIKDHRYLLREICNGNDDDLKIIRAQIRNLAKATAEAYKAERHNKKLGAAGIDTSNVLSMKRDDFKKLDFSNYISGSEK